MLSRERLASLAASGPKPRQPGASGRAVATRKRGRAVREAARRGDVGALRAALAPPGGLSWLAFSRAVEDLAAAGRFEAFGYLLSGFRPGADRGEVRELLSAVAHKAPSPEFVEVFAEFFEPPRASLKIAAARLGGILLVGYGGAGGRDKKEKDRLWRNQGALLAFAAKTKEREVENAKR